MANFFYYDANGTKQGPIAPQELQNLVVQGIVTQETPLETDTGHKGKAGQIKGLFPASQPSPQVQPIPKPVPVQPDGTIPLLRFVVGGGIVLFVLLGIIGIIGIIGINNGGSSSAKNPEDIRRAVLDVEFQIANARNAAIRMFIGRHRFSGAFVGADMREEELRELQAIDTSRCPSDYRKAFRDVVDVTEAACKEMRALGGDNKECSDDLAVKYFKAFNTLNHLAKIYGGEGVTILEDSDWAERLR
ncbi:hypothetical protein FACS1894170_13330 [Planctomycetales bacterium]|nr:hypothetical protein FACS1894170_13330 [Planctomycetales bacterium]